jgi:transposase InsO family protein
MGAVGSAYEDALMESFWARMQVELLDRRKWRTRIELASAIHDYIELWHNTRRRHSALGMRTPTEIEEAWASGDGARWLSLPLASGEFQGQPAAKSLASNPS